MESIELVELHLESAVVDLKSTHVRIGPGCNDKKMECVEVKMMFIDKLEGAAYRYSR